MNMTFEARYEQYRQAVEGYLHSLFAKKPHWADLYDSMRYSILAGGKRIRPVLTLEFARLAGMDWNKALPVACALELVHTYSLIHDDLPCMDNDDLRRGKPACHKVYGEDIALLAGDALQAAAFREVLISNIPEHDRIRCLRALAKAAGPDGVCAGQYLDLQPAPEGSYAVREKWLYEIAKRKTSSLIMAACVMGVCAAGASLEYEAMAEAFGQSLGVAFQVRDDMLDVIGTEEQLGKPIGSDAEQGKMTYMSLFGEKGCLGVMEKEISLAVATFRGEFYDEIEEVEESKFMEELVWDLYDRVK